MYTFTEIEEMVRKNNDNLEKYREKCGSIICEIRKEISERMEIPLEVTSMNIYTDHNELLALDSDYCCEFEILLSFNDKKNDIPIKLKIITARAISFNKKIYNLALEIDVLIDEIGKYIFRSLEVEKRKIDDHLL